MRCGGEENTLALTLAYALGGGNLSDENQAGLRKMQSEEHGDHQKASGHAFVESLVAQIRALCHYPKRIRSYGGEGARWPNVLPGSSQQQT